MPHPLRFTRHGELEVVRVRVFEGPRPADSPNPESRAVTAMPSAPPALRRAARLIVLLTLLASAGADGLLAATITVNSESDAAVPMDGLCTLREAIGAANRNVPSPGGDCPGGEPAPVRDVIEFAIPGPGVHTIMPATLLPELAETVLIDGYSQPGARPNTLAVGSGAVLRIEINGSLIPAVADGNYPPPATWGIMLAASECEIRGLAIGAFEHGILEAFQMGVESSVVVGNFLGTDAAGTAPVPNLRGVLLRGNGSRLGGPAPADRNVISANTIAGAVLEGSDIEVLGNYIGVDPTGTAALPNAGEGILVSGTGSAIGTAEAGNLISGNLGAGVSLRSAFDTKILGNWIGMDATAKAPLGNRVGIRVFGAKGSEIGNPEAGNVIAFNDEGGIVIGPVALWFAEPQSGHRISGNSIYANGALGIDLLGVPGVDVAAGSDPLDADDGDPNGLQNRPVLASAADDGLTLEVDWSLDSAPDTAYAVEFFYSAECDPAGAGEGEVFLGAVQATTDAAGSVAMVASLASPRAAGEDSRGGGRRQGSPGELGAITATATDLGTGNTSELSDCVVVLAREAPVQEKATLSATDLRSPGLRPLTEEKVDWLFEKIARGERIGPDILHAALIGPQSALRADAARILARWGDASSIPHLIHALTDESSHIGVGYPDAGMATTRYWAARSLREMTGRDFGFVWNDPPDQRNAAVQRWSTWFQTVDTKVRDAE